MEHTRAHPILIAAGVAVLLFGLLGAAALTGALPSAMSKLVAPCPNCGVIDSIQQVAVKGKTSGLGAVAGGVAGGLLGNQIGSGNSRAVLTVSGAAGGAFAGDAIEGQMTKQTAWRVTVRLEDGSVKTLLRNSPPPFAVGDRVRIVNGSSLERA